MVLWLLGFLTGTAIFWLASLFFAVKVFLAPKFTRKLPPFLKPKELPEHVIKEIKTKLADSQCSLETSIWLNSLVNWAFINLVEAGPVQSTIRQILSETVIDLRRSALGFILRGSELVSVQVGGTAPELTGVKIITGSALKDPSSELPLTIQFDLEFKGTLKVLTNYDTVFGFKVFMETVLSSFKGPLCFVVQDRTLHFCFVKEPESLLISSRLNLQADPRGPFYHIPLVNSILSSEFILKKLIGLFASFPRFSDLWYRAGPEQPPYPCDIRVRNNPELLFNWKPKTTT